jgi:predicted NACHT family NTPase
LESTFTHYRIRQLEEPQIISFLKTWYQAIQASLSSEDAPETASTQIQQEVDRMTHALQTVPAFRQFAANPLLLRILIQLSPAQAGLPLPQQRAMLYDQMIKSLIEAREISPATVSNISSQSNQSSITHLLSELSYWLHTKKLGGDCQRA